ncbi:gp53-like domain-containing protein [Pseudoduganella violaceinigra]|uniref:gp53-like domain-containing protein n=1 Tax=Pseudoduganella violaceinigra TaxID=246602 RepID=UPI001B7F873C|nr:hypothetical protein [Pseudoduganella violaceinigra]
MKRISTSTRLVDKFGAGKHGFTNGNAVAGIPATDLEDTWFDNVQEELCTVIEAAGIALDGNGRGQLLAALRSAGVFPTLALGDQSSKVATTAFVNPGHSLLGNGYKKLSCGLIFQWFGVSTQANSDFGITFPIIFPNQCFQVIGSYRNDGGSQPVIASFGLLSKTGVNVGAWVSNTGLRAGAQIYCFAIGF